MNYVVSTSMGFYDVAGVEEKPGNSLLINLKKINGGNDLPDPSIISVPGKTADQFNAYVDGIKIEEGLKYKIVPLYGAEFNAFF